MFQNFFILCSVYCMANFYEVIRVYAAKGCSEPLYFGNLIFVNNCLIIIPLPSMCFVWLFLSSSQVIFEFRDGLNNTKEFGICVVLLLLTDPIRTLVFYSSLFVLLTHQAYSSFKAFALAVSILLPTGMQVTYPPTTLGFL